MTGGVFIAIEGTDGSGKTTARKHLFEQLRARGHDVLSITGYYWLKPEYTKVITGARFHKDDYPPRAIAAAYLGDKQAMSAELIDPHLRFRSVLSDRYVVSDVVTLAHTWGIPPIDTYLQYLDSSIRKPDLIIFMDTPPEVSSRRLDTRKSTVRHPWEYLAALEKAYALFTELLTGSLPPLAPVARVDGTLPLEQVLQTVSRLVLQRLPDPAPI